MEERWQKSRDTPDPQTRCTGLEWESNPTGTPVPAGPVPRWQPLAPSAAGHEEEGVSWWHGAPVSTGRGRRHRGERSLRPDPSQGEKSEHAIIKRTI